ncbi:glycosyltransferase family 4 protein [Halobaculum limi]|uniref:glycosyltransferase family 4 protein n=1 Tax=Halobaculum limi TaxID=3031916 RepID=UPI002406244D|nr:glycosyltransferase family 4 protein [Halobaculum sp. YSMS11]
MNGENPLTVALVVPGDPETTSGGFRYDRRLVEQLRATGVDVRVFSVPWRRYPLGVVDTLGLATGVPNRLSDADVVLVDELAHPGTVGLAARLEWSETPVVALVHHLQCVEGRSLAPVARRLERLFLQRCSAAVCVSRATERDVRSLAGKQIRTHRAPPPADQFDPSVTPGDVAVRARTVPFRVVSLGSLVPRKGHATLLRALTDLDADWSLAVVGPEPEPNHAAAMRSLTADLGVRSQVAFHGELSSDDLTDVLRDSHALAIPSAYEGFGMAYLEGMGFGLPAVASSAGGAESVVTDGENGFLVDPGDVAGVRAALSSLATDRERLAAMGEAALARFAAHPEWADTVAGVRAFLTEVAYGG